ncbi:MAG: FtsX-like permease family protein [Bdellovibrionota bacterium]
MKYQSLIAIRNLKKNWRHSLAALLSITAAFFSIVVFQGYMVRVEDLYLESYRHRAMLGDLIIENRTLRTPEGKSEPWRFLITKEEQDSIKSFLKANSDVDQHVSFLTTQGLITNGKTAVIFVGYGYDVDNGYPVRGEKWQFNTLFGKPLTNAPSEPIPIESQVLLGQALARTMGCLGDPDQKIYDRDGYYYPNERSFSCKNPNIQLSGTTISGQLNAMDLQVQGIMDAGYADVDQRWVVMPLPTAQTLYNTDQITYMSVLLKNPNMVPRFVKAFSEQIESQHPNLKIQKWQDHMLGDLYMRTMELLSIFRNFVVIVIVSISTLSVFNTMMKIILERTREIGMLRSLGFKQNMVRMIFVLESLYLTVVACGIGAIFSMLFSFTVSRMGIMYKAGLLSEPIAFKILISPKAYLLSFILLMIISGITTWSVAGRILRKKIIDCLNHA